MTWRPGNSPNQLVIWAVSLLPLKPVDFFGVDIAFFAFTGSRSLDENCSTEEPEETRLWTIIYK